MNVYDFIVKAQDGKDVALSNYKGKVLLIVNTATGYGFTPQYEELQNLYDAHQKDGLEILDFPCNQFGEQAPGSNEEIHSFCTLKYGTSFQQFAKIDVFGDNQIPLYKWLEENSKIKWNFTKFLIDREGNLVARFEPTTAMKEVRKQVEAIL